MNNKHKKIKNTGILYELLVRQIASDIISNKNTIAESVLKKYFNSTTELGKELILYKSLLDNKFKNENHASELVKTVISERKKLNYIKLKTEKYNLIKELNTNFKSDEFFKTKINNYKLFASIYKLFEYSLGKKIDPVEFVKCKTTLIEHISNKNKVVLAEDKDELIKEYGQLTSDLKLITYKLSVDKFNDKYKVLDSKQKKLLKEYINNISNTVELKHYVDSELNEVNKTLKSVIKNVNTEEKLKIKLNQVLVESNNVIKGQTTKDEHIIMLLKLYQLINELKTV